MTNKLSNDVNVAGNKLRAILAERKLSQSELSQMSRIGTQIISRIINEKVKIVSSVTAILLCAALGVTEEELFPNGAQR